MKFQYVLKIAIVDNMLWVNLIQRKKKGYVNFSFIYEKEMFKTMGHKNDKFDNKSKTIN